ncbi:matrixin family metalloprotease [Aquisphaera insulae]|uniref:matrixin family metalloprotease n=1 Tax=Aquisphaera insulae TaxID=2712864 RepID=UPI0013EA3F5F|nr:matrixin family metalloprotease [Aquisphaera insulae]
MLYSTLGAQWVYASRITYSFVPDGANIGGYSSSLYATLNAKYPTATWQLQFQKAAAVWQAVAGINLCQVGDDGSTLGAYGNQQGDSRFGDIRISAVPQSSGTLAICLTPPPVNGGSEAGDLIFNSTSNWGINTNYDLETVAIHEFGHALGLDHSAITTACMYAYFNGFKQSLTTDDINGIQSIWGSGKTDIFNSNGQSNGVYTSAPNISGYLNSTTAQAAIPNLSITKTGQSEWFAVTVPANTTGTFVTTVQSTNLSIFSPKLQVLSTSMALLGSATSSDYGATVSVSLSGVRAGTTYYVRVSGNTAGNPFGGYGLLVNFGSQAQSPIAPPNTTVAWAASQGGGSESEGHDLVSIGNFTSYGDALEVSTAGVRMRAVTHPAAVPSAIAGQTAVSTSAIDPGFWTAHAVAKVGRTDRASTPSLPIVHSAGRRVSHAFDAAIAAWKGRGLIDWADA